MHGKRLHTQIDEQIVFEQLDYNEYAIWSLLLASGYLKAEKFTVDEVSGREDYELSITNKEVNIMFQRIIEDWFARFAPSYNEFIKALLLGDTRAMNTYMNRTALATFSCLACVKRSSGPFLSSFDTGKRPSATTEPERFYHGFVLGLMVDLADRYSITSNRESGFGRYDVLLEPYSKNDTAIILEFKVRDPEEEKTLLDCAEAALKQIEEMKYAATLESKGFSTDKIRAYAFAFEGKTVLVKSPQQTDKA